MYDNSVKVTIFTATYNRYTLLKKLYKSLLKQSCKNFEWVIVDDGSTDNTENLINSWSRKNNGFSIKYIKVKNGGKHRAINKGIDIANGELFYIVDSDDYLVNNAIEKIISWESKINSKKKYYAGIAGAKGYDKENIIGSRFKGEYIDATSLQRDKFNIKGDKAEVFYTEVLINNKFPEFEGENFITESAVWFEIANKGLKIRWYNDIICICEYQCDGLSNQGYKLFYDNPIGALYALKKEVTYSSFSFKRRAYAINKYIKIASSVGKSLKEVADDLSMNYYFIKSIKLLYDMKDKRYRCE